MKENFKYLFLIILAFLGSYLIYKIPMRINGNINKVDLERAKNVMIVAHPDDETLWGGAHLLKDDYLVVCVTCGRSKERVEEFKQVMAKTNNQYMMLAYPDKTRGKRDDWSKVYNDIEKDIYKIIGSKKWNMIVTHNSKGEYGHIHHKMLNTIVTKETNLLELDNRLYYFGNYYSKKKIKRVEQSLPRLKPKELKEKKELLKLYRSQSFIDTTFDQMYPYEVWTKYQK